MTTVAGVPFATAVELMPNHRFTCHFSLIRRRYIPDATVSQHPTSRNESECVVREGRCLKKPWDTVGELKSAEICVSHMPSLKAKKPRKLVQEKVFFEP